MSQFPVACFAPDLKKSQLGKYEDLMQTITDPQIKDYYGICLNCVKQWWELPESTVAPKETLKVLHQGAEKQFSVVPLETAHQEQLFDSIPWLSDCETIGKAFDILPQGELRNAAFHLLWYVTELTNDREPITQSKLL